MSKLVSFVTAVVNAVFTRPINAVVKKLGLPSTVASVALHVVLTFLTAFVSQVAGASFAHVNWPTIFALLTSAAAAGVSAVLHYLTGLVPTVADRKAAKG